MQLKRFHKLRQPAAAAGMLVVLVTPATSALAPLDQFWPRLKPDPRESRGRAVPPDERDGELCTASATEPARNG